MELMQVMSVADTIVGVAVGMSGGAFATVKVLSRRNKNQANKVDGAIAEFGRKYYTLSELVDGLKKRYESAKYDLTLEWPDSNLSFHYLNDARDLIENCEQALRIMLENLNLLKDTSASKEQVKRAIGLLSETSRVLHTAMIEESNKITKFEGQSKEILERLKVLRHDLSEKQRVHREAEKQDRTLLAKYDPVYLHELPNLNFAAKKALEDYEYLMRNLPLHKIEHKEGPEVARIRKAASHQQYLYVAKIHELANFTATALELGAKMRATLKRATIPHEQREMVLKMILTAETADYSSGNPRQKFYSLINGLDEILL